jgi:hypothetical protein
MITVMSKPDSKSLQKMKLFLENMKNGRAQTQKKNESMKIKIIMIGLFLFIGCDSTEQNRSKISDNNGISWEILQQDKNDYVGAKYSYGITLYSSGKGFWFYLNRESGSESPIFYGCDDCGDPLTLKSVLFDWKIEKDSIFIGKHKYRLDKLSSDSLIVANNQENISFRKIF